MDPFAILTYLLKIGASPGGQALLAKVFADHNVSKESLKASVDALKPPPDLPPVKEKP